MRAIAAPVLLALALSGCEEPNAPADTVAGRYALQSVNGQPLPWRSAEPGAAVLVADTVTFARDGSWTEVRWTAASPGETPTHAARFGFWEVEGATLRVQDPLVSSSLAAVVLYEVGAGGREFTTASGAARPVERFVRLR